MRSHSIPLLFGTSIAIVGLVGVLLATPHGIGLSPDSVSYIGGARNIVAGRGYTMPPSGEPITHRAPLYASVLAALALVGPEPAAGARWLGAALFALNLSLIWMLASRACGGPAAAFGWVPAGMAALALAAPPMWEIHLMAWTEPAYISLCLTGVWLTAVYLGDADYKWLVAAAVSVGLATLTRYAGLSMVGACCLALLLFEPRPIARRIADGFLFGAIGLTPLGLWTFRNMLQAGTATSRSIVFHPIDADRLREALGTLASWLLVPANSAGWVKLGTIVAVGSLMVGGAYFSLKSYPGGAARGRLRSVPDVVKVTLIAAVVYPLFLVMSISLVDANTPLDQRILSPLFVLALILAAFALHSWSPVFSLGRVRRYLTVGLVCVIWFAYLGLSFPLISRSYREGLGFNNQRWRHSGLVQALGTLPPSATIYSNSPEAIYYHTGRAANGLPSPFSVVTRSANPTYEQELASVSRDLDRGGLLVCFDLGSGPVTDRAKLVVEALGLAPLEEYPDGAIYGRPGFGAERGTT